MGKVLVCGGRTYDNAAYLVGFMDCFHDRVGITLVVQGGAPGADRLALQWARLRGVSVSTHSANWKKHGKAAGPIRNRFMYDNERPDVVIAFPGGVGTEDMVAYAKSKGCHIVRAQGV